MRRAAEYANIVRAYADVCAVVDIEVNVTEKVEI